MTPFGVLAGAKIPIHALTSKPGIFNPSATVGSSGNKDDLRKPPTARARTLSALM